MLRRIKNIPIKNIKKHTYIGFRLLANMPLVISLSGALLSIPTRKEMPKLMRVNAKPATEIKHNDKPAQPGTSLSQNGRINAFHMGNPKVFATAVYAIANTSGTRMKSLLSVCPNTMARIPCFLNIAARIWTIITKSANKQRLNIFCINLLSRPFPYKRLFDGVHLLFRS